MARRQSYPALGGGRIIRAGTKASENEKIPVSKALKNKIAGRSRKTAEKARLRRLCKQRSCGRHTYHYPGKLMQEICGGLNQFQLKFALTQKEHCIGAMSSNIRLPVYSIARNADTDIKGHLVFPIIEQRKENAGISVLAWEPTI